MNFSMAGKCRMRRGLTLACGLLACSGAHAQTTRSGVDVSAEAAATSNPYLSDDDSRWVGAGRIEARPWLSIQTQSATFDLAAYTSGRVFSGIYDLEDNEGASLTYRSQRSAQTSLYASANVSSSSARSVSQLRQPIPSVTDPVNPADPDMAVTEPLPFVPGDDITLLGLIGRSTSVDLGLGVDNQLNARSFVGFNAGYQRLSVAGAQFSSYDSLNVGARFLRQFSARTKAGVSAGARRTSYEAGGNAATYNLEATADHQLNAYWFLNASAGVSTTRSSATQLRPASSSTGLSGSLDLCNRLPRRDICFNFQRAQRPGGLGTVQTVDGVGVRYSERISARNRMDLYARYSRSEAVGEDDPSFPDSEVASVQANLTRTLNDSSEAYAFVSAARTYGGIVSNDPSASAGIGVRLKLGRRR